MCVLSCVRVCVCLALIRAQNIHDKWIRDYLCKWCRFTSIHYYKFLSLWLASFCFHNPHPDQSQKPSSFVHYPIKEKWWIQDIFPSQLIDDEMVRERNRERNGEEKKGGKSEWNAKKYSKKAPDIRNTNRYRSPEYLSHLWSYLCTWAPTDSLTARSLSLSFSVPQSIIDERWHFTLWL